MATLPFLYDISDATDGIPMRNWRIWSRFRSRPPGPVGVNMATYVGFTTAGVPGAVIATLGVVTPSIIVILIIAGFLKSFRKNRLVNRAFYGFASGLSGINCGRNIAHY